MRACHINCENMEITFMTISIERCRYWIRWASSFWLKTKWIRTIECYYILKLFSDKTACKFCSIIFRWEIFNIQKEICNNYGACSFNWLKRRSVDPILCVRVASDTQLWVKVRCINFSDCEIRKLTVVFVCWATVREILIVIYCL